jgi:hypothetical protein
MGSCYVVKEMVAIEIAWKVTLTGGNSGGGGGRNGRLFREYTANTNRRATNLTTLAHFQT